MRFIDSDQIDGQGSEIFLEKARLQSFRGDIQEFAIAVGSQFQDIDHFLAARRMHVVGFLEQIAVDKRAFPD